MLIGRQTEESILKDALKEDQSQFIAVYGRRRVGKTYLIREAYNYDFSFQFSGAANISNASQLDRFSHALKEQGLSQVAQIKDWFDAFYELEKLLKSLPNEKKVVFLDELPWMDSPRSSFVSALEAFWNGWASARKDIVLVVCGSATSWMVKKIIRNKGGLYNRLNHRILLKPFSLKLCEEYTISRNLRFSRQQIMEAYMVFGGVPYYWSLLRKGASIPQEIDRLVFSEEGELHYEFDMLYAALFASPEPYLAVIEQLAKKKSGQTRAMLLESCGLKSNGKFSSILQDLEWCGFIRSYSMLGNLSKGEMYQLIDQFTLFYYSFLKNKHNSDNYWQSIQNTPLVNTWKGLAFEKICLWHTNQIKQKLGISGILANIYSWHIKENKQTGTPGTQIDLLIDRKDGVIDLCEIKYSKDKYSITQEYASEINQKHAIFMENTSSKKAIHIVMITSNGLVHNEYWGDIQNEICTEDLFN